LCDGGSVQLICACAFFLCLAAFVSLTFFILPTLFVAFGVAADIFLLFFFSACPLSASQYMK